MFCDCVTIGVVD